METKLHTYWWTRVLAYKHVGIGACFKFEPLAIFATRIVIIRHTELWICETPCKGALATHEAEVISDGIIHIPPLSTASQIRVADQIGWIVNVKPIIISA